MSLRFKAGDPVWVNGEDEGQVLRVDTHQPTVPYYIATKRGATCYQPYRVAPRVIDAKPTTWRLPEPGDAVEVTFGVEAGTKTFIRNVDWTHKYPIKLVGTAHDYDLRHVQLVRLRDTPEPTSAPDPIESAVAAMASEPTNKPSEPEPTPEAKDEFQVDDEVYEGQRRGRVVAPCTYEPNAVLTEFDDIKLCWPMVVQKSKLARTGKKWMPPTTSTKLQAPGFMKVYLASAIDVLAIAEQDVDGDLGDDFLLAAVQVALPLLREVRDELD